jgi:segregation and condensation protein B
MEDSKAIIEAIIFTSENPVQIDKIREVLPDVEKGEISCLLKELMDEYEKRSGGFLLLEVAGGFQFRTRADLGYWINKFLKGRPAILSRAAMETLAVIAYKQPVLKSEVDRFRGVDSGSSLKGLLERKLVRIMGRKDVPGRPIMYGTTKKFLEVFNLKDLAELPTLKEMKDLHEGT